MFEMKNHVRSLIMFSLKFIDRYKLWADECSKLFQGVDILCVEAIHTKKDTERIIEVRLDSGVSATINKEEQRMLSRQSNEMSCGFEDSFLLCYKA